MARAVGLVTTNYDMMHESVLTAARPAAALPIMGRYRMLDFAMSNMVNSGIKDLGFILPSNYRSIADHMGSGKDFFLSRKGGGLFLMPGSAFGSTVKNARFTLRDFKDNRVYVERAKFPYIICAAANIVHNMDYNELLDTHIQSGSDITVLTHKYPGFVEALRGFEFDEKGRCSSIEYGAQPGKSAFLDVFVINQKTLLDILDWYDGADHMDLFDAVKIDLNRIKVTEHDYDGVAMPVFSEQDYYYNSMNLLDPKNVDLLFKPERPIYTKSHDNPPVVYGKSASVKNCIVSGGSIINGVIENSILGRDVEIEKGAFVKDSVIMQSTVIKAEAHIECAIIDRNNCIAPKTKICGTRDDVYVQTKGSL